MALSIKSIELSLWGDCSKHHLLSCPPKQKAGPPKTSFLCLRQPGYPVPLIPIGPRDPWLSDPALRQVWLYRTTFVSAWRDFSERAADLDTKEEEKRGIKASNLPPHPSLRRSNYHSRPGLLTLPTPIAFPPGSPTLN